MPPSGFVLCRRMRRRGSFVEGCVWPFSIVEADPVFDHAFGLEAVLQFVEINGLLF